MGCSIEPLIGASEDCLAHPYTPKKNIVFFYSSISSFTDWLCGIPRITPENPSTLSRQDAAQSLMSLAQRKFDDCRTWSGWIQSTAKGVMEIANKVHPLTPFLLQQSTGGQGGGTSHITDLTDWDGKKKKGLQ